jgi:Ca2+:H+ antiporter
MYENKIRNFLEGAVYMHTKVIVFHLLFITVSFKPLEQRETEEHTPLSCFTFLQFSDIDHWFCCKPSMASLQEPWLLENGNLKGSRKEMRHGRTAHNMSSSSLRKKSDLTLVSKVKCGMLRLLLTNLQEVILGTKLSVLFPAIPLAIAAQCYGFGRVSIHFPIFQ